MSAPKVLFGDYQSRVTRGGLTPREWGGIRLERWQGATSGKQVGIRLYVDPALKRSRVNITARGDIVADPAGVFRVNPQGFISLGRLTPAELKQLSSALDTPVIERVAGGR